MGMIAIASNPASGRDIRRLVSHATVYSNREKENIVERIILAAYQMGEHSFCVMPDSFGFGQQIVQHLADDLHEIPRDSIIIPDLPTMDQQEDTTYFSRYAEKQGAQVLIVLGGDGTSRAAAKGVSDIPLIALSTGTNNVYPSMTEGTIAGMAAAAISNGAANPKDCCLRSKRIEVYKNSAFVDLALIDAVFCPALYTGAKALWDQSDVRRVFVTQCSPASIGFSALPGGSTVIGPEDDFGAVTDCLDGPANTRVAMGAGIIAEFSLSKPLVIPVGQGLSYRMDYSGMLALDGEREVSWRKGDLIELRITRNGPNKVDIHKALLLAQKVGYFQVPHLGDKQGVFRS